MWKEISRLHSSGRRGSPSLGCETETDQTKLPQRVAWLLAVVLASLACGWNPQAPTCTDDGGICLGADG